MHTQLSTQRLRCLRNEVRIIPLISEALEMHHKISDGKFRFLCPCCHDYDTACNPKTNLARCFRCRRNFNPIDLVMAVQRYSFLQAVEFLDRILARRAALRDLFRPRAGQPPHTHPTQTP